MLLCGSSLSEGAPSLKETRLSIWAFIIGFASKNNSILGFSVKLGLRFFFQSQKREQQSQKYIWGMNE